MATQLPSQPSDLLKNCVNPRTVPSDPCLHRLFPRSLLRRYGARPLARLGDRIMVGMRDPSDSIAVYDLQLASGLHIFPLRMSRRGGSLPSWESVLSQCVDPPVTLATTQSSLPRPVRRLRKITVQHRFVTSDKDSVEAAYTFPVQSGLAIEEVRVILGQQVLVGQLEERGVARACYEGGKRCGRHVELIEHQRDDVFVFKMGNVSAGEQVSLEITYSERVNSAGVRRPLILPPRRARSFALREHMLTRYTSYLLVAG